MIPLFVDTSGWVEFLLHSEPFHAQSVFLLAHARRNRAAVVTTNYVMAELVALLTSPMRIPRQEQLRILETLRAADWITTLHVSPKQEQVAWELLASHDDKKWSFVDCTSFVLMKQMSIRSALTTDHHFEQAGFLRLLKRKD